MNINNIGGPGCRLLRKRKKAIKIIGSTFVSLDGRVNFYINKTRTYIKASNPSKVYKEYEGSLATKVIRGDAQDILVYTSYISYYRLKKGFVKV